MNPTNESTDSSNTTHRSRWQRFSPSMGWKSFWSEIVIVILGVLIALAANEAVQNWNWQNKVRDGELRLQADMAYLFNLSAEQYAITPCAQVQLTTISQKLVQSGNAWAPIKVHFDETINLRYVVRIPARTQTFAVWESLLADGTATRFPQERQAMYDSINSRIKRLQNPNDEANQLARRLLALGYPMALSDDTRSNFLVMTEEIHALMNQVELVSKQRMVSIAEFGSAPEAKAVDASVAESGTVKFCKAQGYPLADWREALKQ